MANAQPRRSAGRTRTAPRAGAAAGDVAVHRGLKAGVGTFSGQHAETRRKLQSEPTVASLVGMRSVLWLTMLSIACGGSKLAPVNFDPVPDAGSGSVTPPAADAGAATDAGGAIDGGP